MQRKLLVFLFASILLLIACGQETAEQVKDTVEYKMDEIRGYQRVAAPNEIGLYIDESMIIESIDGNPMVYPITDYIIYENKLMVDMLEVDLVQDYIFKTTNIYTIYEEGNSKSIRESLNPTQENVKYHYEGKETPEFIKQNMNDDQSRDLYLKWEMNKRGKQSQNTYMNYRRNIHSIRGK